MDQYLQCIYEYLEENKLYWALRGDEEYVERDRDAQREKDRLWQELTKEQHIRLERCCTACMVAQSVSQEKFFEFGVAVGKYMAR